MLHCHVTATAEERNAEHAALREATRHFGEEAAAAARAKGHVRDAASLKAQEEAAIAAAHTAAQVSGGVGGIMLLALHGCQRAPAAPVTCMRMTLRLQEEAHCIAEIRILEDRLEKARRIKADMEQQANAAQRASEEATRLAAEDAAAVDAHSKAVALVHERAVAAARFARRAEDEWQLAETMREEAAGLAPAGTAAAVGRAKAMTASTAAGGQGVATLAPPARVTRGSPATDVSNRSIPADDTALADIPSDEETKPLLAAGGAAVGGAGTGTGSAVGPAPTTLAPPAPPKTVKDAPSVSR